MSKHSVIVITLAFMFLIETTLFHWMIPLTWQQNFTFSPRFVLVLVLFVALFMNRHFALVLGLMFGLLHDIVFYGYMIGPYAFGMGLVAYLTGLLLRNITPNFFITISAIMIGIFCFSLIDYSLYSLFRIVDFSLSWTFVHHILPSLLINLFFVLILYMPARLVIERWDAKAQQRDS